MSRFRVMLVNGVSKGHTRRFADAFLISGLMWIASFTLRAPSHSFHVRSCSSPMCWRPDAPFLCCDLQRKSVTHFSAVALAGALELAVSHKNYSD